MSWFSKLFARSSATPARHEPGLTQVAASEKKRSTAARFRVSGGILNVDDFGFVGSAETSPNKRWLVGYRDASHGIPLGPNEPLVLLIDREADAVVHGVSNFRRPSHAAVSDVGVYVIDDGTFDSALASDAVIVDKDRNVLFRRSYSAIIFAVAISPGGRYVAVQTCNSGSTDSSLLEVLDAKAKKVLFSVSPRTAWSLKYWFDVDPGSGDLKRLQVEVKGLGRFSYMPDGSFADVERLREAAMSKGHISERVQAARSVFAESKDAEILAKVLKVATEAASSVSEYEWSWKISAQRLQGEVLEELGRDDEAVKLYEAMLAANPKAGVKGRLNALRKRR